MRKHFAELTITEQHEVAPRLFHARFQLPPDGEDAGTAANETGDANTAFLPGNFLMLRCDPAEPYRLMRPMSVLSFEKSAKTVDILYRVVGDQTRKLMLTSPGTKLPALFPLGNHFALPSDTATPIVMVAGGTGLPPLLFLASHLQEHGFPKPTFLIGAKDRSQLPTAFLDPWPAESRFATDDGSAGLRGTVIDLLASEGLPPNAWLYSCGPRPMLRALQEFLQYRAVARCQASLEEMMACGTGACYGCAVGFKAEGMEARKLVCRDGPIFELSQVRFD